MYFVPGDSPTLWLGLVFICCVVFGFALPLHFTMVAFADEYGVFKTGVRTSGMNFAFNLFFIKLAWALSGLIISGVLVAVSYSAGAERTKRRFRYKVSRYFQPSSQAYCIYSLL
ncbi:MFS transporter [Vibrio parahaemolyticus]|uniref:MFS transporter n=1 Tax=Vibrio parahaemolyticus TaxID=670 RepID=UPI001C576E03